MTDNRLPEPLSAEEEARFRESVRLLRVAEDEHALETPQWMNHAAERLLATLDAARQAAPSREALAAVESAVASGNVEVIDAYGTWDESRDTRHRWVRLDALYSALSANPVIQSSEPDLPRQDLIDAIVEAVRRGNNVATLDAIAAYATAVREDERSVIQPSDDGLDAELNQLRDGLRERASLGTGGWSSGYLAALDDLAARLRGKP